MWAQYDSYLTAMRDILGLRLPEHDKYTAWEDCAIHGGYRFMHERFCIVCDFPEFIKTDENHEPHCIDGPSHRWRDGWELFHLWGVRIEPEMLDYDARQIMAVENAEQRMTLIKRAGLENMLEHLDSQCLDSRDGYDLLTLNINDRPCEYLKMVNPTTGEIHVEGIKPGIKTVNQAIAWRMGLDVYENPKFTA